MLNVCMDEKRCAELKDMALTLPSVSLDDHQLCDFELISNGGLAPLTGYLGRADHDAVMAHMHLQSGQFWPLPISLEVSEETARGFKAADMIALRDPEGFMLAVMHLQEIWPVSPEKEAQTIFGTRDEGHPGVQRLMAQRGHVHLGGSLEVVSLPLHFNYQHLRLTPAEVRNNFKKLGWKRVLGFQTRHPIHRAQHEMLIQAMQAADANLLMLPVVGPSRAEDFDQFTRIRCYQAIHSYFPPNSMSLSLLSYAPRKAGIREALLKMIISRNFGCTHALVDPGFVAASDSKSARSEWNGEVLDDARLSELSDELGIEVVFSEKMLYLPYEDEYRPQSRISESDRPMDFTNADVRERVKQGKRMPPWVTFPEVVRELKKTYPSPKKQGLTVFFTGLSGAGKSTIAKILYARFLEIGTRPATLLDGDIVRTNLSSELTFSKAHRDINVRRIGFVASEITKNRGVAICAPIAPYEETRRDIRRAIELYGGFIEVYVATPFAVCEQRDRKGMYAKARAGLIKGFTGFDDPYEEPLSPEIRIDTSGLAPDEAAQQIMLYLGQRRFI